MQFFKIEIHGSHSLIVFAMHGTEEEDKKQSYRIMENEVKTVIGEEKQDAEHQVMTANEYATLVRQWLADVYHWQCFQTLLPYYFLEQEELNRTGQAASVSPFKSCLAFAH